MYKKALSLLCAITYCSAQSFNSPNLDWIQTDGTGAYQFGYATGDEGRHYHVSSATADNTVAGRFGYKDPVTGGDLQTTYTAGRRGFRARGPHIARRMDLSQTKPPFSRPDDDGQYHPELNNYFDPNEDRGYDFSYRTPNHIKEEHANRVGDVQGRYSYVDDIGFRHNVDYIAGSKTGFVVTNPVPDTFAQARGGPLYFVGKEGSKVRGFSAVQKNVNGAYRFLASGPDHKRSEVSDASGNRRGVYTYLDDRGVQHTVEYIAGPKIGYKVINNKKGASYNAPLPFFPDSSTPLPLFPSSTSGSGGGSRPDSAFPSTPLPPSPPSGSDLFTPLSPPEGSFPSFPSSSGSGQGSSFPSLGGTGQGSSFPSLGGSGQGSSFPSLGGTGQGPSFPSSSGGGQGSSSPNNQPTSAGLAKPSGGSTSGDNSLGRPNPSGSDSGSASFPFQKPEDFSAVSPFFPSTSPFPPAKPPKPQRPPGAKPGDPDQKWNYDFDYFFNDPSNSNKDWSKPINRPSTTKVPLLPSTPLTPTFDPFSDFSPSPFPDPPSFLPPFFNEGLNTAESGNGLKPPFGNKGKENCKDGSSKDKNDSSSSSEQGDRNQGSQSGSGGSKEGSGKHKNGKGIYYPSRGTVKFGGVRKNEWHSGEDSGYFAIPPGVAVRAHVQSLDIVPYKRFESPGEALKNLGDKREAKNFV